MVVLPVLLMLGLALAKTTKFTPKDMLALPRPQGLIASPDGQWGVEVVSQWAFKKRQSHSAIYLISLNTSLPTAAPTTLLTSTHHSSFSQPFFLTPSLLAYLNTTASVPALYSLDLNLSAPPSAAPPQLLLTFPTAPESIKYLPPAEGKGKGDGVIAFSAYVWKGAVIEDTARLDDEWEDRGDSARIWDDLYIKHWDTWRNPHKIHQIFITILPIKPVSPSKPTFLAPFNASSTYSQSDPFSSSDFSLAHHPSGSSSIQLVLQIKDKYLSEAFHTRRQVYYTSFSLATPSPLTTAAAPPPTMLTSATQGAVTSLSFSPDGTKVGWLENRKDGNEADRNRVVVVTLGGAGGGSAARKRVEWTEEWDRSPSALIWSLDSQSIYLLAENQGSVLPYHLTHPALLPTPLLFNGTTTSLTPLPSSFLLLERSTMTHPTESYLLFHNASADAGDSDKTPPELQRITGWSDDGLKGKALQQPEKFWFKGWGGRDIMGWLIKPKGWDEGAKAGAAASWPLAFLIHGGPEGAWEDGWSSRWNPELYAEQGYFTVAINPTGSTGYGQQLTDDIKEHWGDRPFKDLVAGLHYILDLYPEIDRERLAALGASYGGYMINWMMGHNDQTNFKTFVCHDGVFDTFAMWYSTEEVYFSTAESGGLSPWEDRNAYEKWSPVNFVSEWKTPALIIQGGQDFRIPEAQAIGMFTTLQKRGIPSRYVFFPDENHWVLKAQNSLKWHHEVFRWLDEWVGETPATIAEQTLGRGTAQRVLA